MQSGRLVRSVASGERFCTDQAGVSGLTFSLNLASGPAGVRCRNMRIGLVQGTTVARCANDLHERAFRKPAARGIGIKRDESAARCYKLRASSADSAVSVRVVPTIVKAAFSTRPGNTKHAEAEDEIPPPRALRALVLAAGGHHRDGRRGHPIGATGAVLTTRLLHSMKRDGIKRGVVTLCIGGGQGIALALEAVW